MVSSEEIARVAKMMRIDLDDHGEHADRIREMIAYFEILDGAGIEDHELDAPAIPMEQLRDDECVPYGPDLLRHIKTYRGRHVRAPKTAR